METTTCSARPIVRQTPLAPQFQQHTFAPFPPAKSGLSDQRTRQSTQATPLSKDQKKAFRILRSIRAELQSRNPEIPLPSSWFIRQLVYKYFIHQQEDEWMRSIHLMLVHCLGLARGQCFSDRVCDIQSAQLPTEHGFNQRDMAIFLRHCLQLNASLAPLSDAASPGVAPHSSAEFLHK